ncbi:TlpA family protein disulfide reductase [Rheinheimera riviphila]|uniref:TlpA family protein disulfide reductase n=1 Tax=Rheinheimera riviphila TaxID=1834037 RepID=A0A437QA07_9GAMM|nr:TlpA disulfide reductase family protein [Rheinheimera riviphila]RVU31269.1 TlpA family protein disulfide reductase [Rheinheimera riviphila]
MNLKITLLISLLPLLPACSTLAEVPAPVKPSAKISATASTSSAPTTAARPVRQTEQRLKAGDLMPLTTLTSIENQQVSLTQPNQRKLVIFFGTTCHDSQRAFQKIIASPLVNQTDLQIVGIGREENVASLRKFATEYQVTFPLVVDADRAMYHQFTNVGIPRIVLVDENNRIVKSFLGEIPDVLTEIHW